MNYKIWILSGILLLLVLWYVESNFHTIRVTVNEQHTAINRNELWVEVSLLEDENRMFVRRGSSLIKEMACSGGIPSSPTVTGIYYLQNRGEWFYSERFQEGAYYWVRFHEQFLVHSVPFDRDKNIIQEEQDKIGKYASHGCVRLKLLDAKWFYENVPDGTMIAIHY